MAAEKSNLRPSKTDWLFQPPAWTSALANPTLDAVPTGAGFGYKTNIFHNSKNAQITAEQKPGKIGAQHTTFAADVRFSEFNGTYISFAVGLPLDILTNLSRRNLIEVDFAMETKGIDRVFVRLNAENGPNLDRSTKEVPMTSEPVMIGFDMAHFHFNVGSTQKIWVDITFDCQEKGSILLQDLNIFRRIRAAI